MCYEIEDEYAHTTQQIVIARSEAVARRSRGKLGADSSLRSEQAPQSLILGLGFQRHNA